MMMAKAKRGEGLHERPTPVYTEPRVQSAKPFHGLISRPKTSPFRPPNQAVNDFHGLISQPLVLAHFQGDHDCMMAVLHLSFSP